MKFVWWLPAIIFAGLIYWFSDQSQPPGGELSPDYVLHFLGYGIFSIAVGVGMTRGFQEKLTGIRALMAFLIVVVYGCFDEFHQSFVPGRVGSGTDILADAFGALCFLVLAFFFRRSRTWRLGS